MRDILKKIGAYLTFKKQENDEVFVRQMHMINRISILLFLGALIYLIVKLTR